MDPKSITPGRAGLGAAPCKSTKPWPTPSACLSRLLRDRTQLRELSGKTEPSRDFSLKLPIGPVWTTPGRRAARDRAGGNNLGARKNRPGNRPDRPEPCARS